MPLFSDLDAAYCSETGTAHAVNEDACWITPPLYAVADGVGGGDHGEVASRALLAHCAEATEDIYADAENLAAWLRKGDAAVREAVAQNGGKRGASTLVAAWRLTADTFHIVNIGDCRAYWLRPGWRGWHIRPVTIDQTYAKLGVPPPPQGSPDDPARMAGVGAVGNPPVHRLALGGGEMLLLCSDGLHKFLDEPEIAALCRAGLESGETLAQTAHRLVDVAQANGSYDDVSAVLVRRSGTAGWRARLQDLLSFRLRG